MPRKRRTEKKKPYVEISAGLMAYLTDGTMPEDPESKYEIYELEAGEGEELRELWERVRTPVLRKFIAQNPGRRPAVWWRLDSPRMTLGNWPHPVQAMRSLLPGVGCPSWESAKGASDRPWLERGLPRWEGYDRSQPPIFESEAAFLRRHALLRVGEIAKLTAADFDAVEVLEDPDLKPAVI